MGYKRNANYAKAEWKEQKQLVAGGYIIGLIGCEETFSKKNKPMLKFCFDIADGEYKYFYSDKQKTNSDKKWPFQAHYYVMLPADDADENDATLCRFKDFMDAIEMSNPNKNFWNGDDLNINAFRGSLIGGLFGEEEYVIKSGQRTGQIGTSVRIREVISLERLKGNDYTLPERIPVKDDNMVPANDAVFMAPQYAAPNPFTAPEPAPAAEPQRQGLDSLFAGFTPTDPGLIAGDPDIPF